MKTTEHLQEALNIITKSNNIKVSFNVPVNDHYSNVYHILIHESNAMVIIHESNAKVISDLIEAGFSLSMTPKGLSVNKY